MLVQAALAGVHAYVSLSSRRILVVGGASRLGRAICESAPANASVRIVLRRQSPATGSPDDRKVVVDDYGALPDHAFEEVDAVVNCVGVVSTRDADSYRRINVGVPIALAEAVRKHKVRHLVHVSSLSVYGEQDHLRTGTPETATSLYGRSKLAGDQALLGADLPDTTVTILRLPTLYGQNSTNKIARLARLASSIGWFPSPRPLAQRSVLHIENAAAVVWSLLTKPQPGIVLAADVEPFDLSVLGAVLSESGMAPFRPIRLPRAMLAPLRLAAPGLYASLYRDSLIEESANVASQLSLPITLREGVRRQLELLHGGSRP
jgi:nucleoside-diphosphate-sugar epimerase